MRKLVLFLAAGFAFVHAAESNWKPLPLIKGDRVDPAWTQVGFGKFVVDGDAIKTDPAPEGLGLLVYKKEKLGNCQIRVVYKTKEARSNSGVYVRINDGILDQAKTPGAKFERDASGKISEASMKKAQEAAAREEGPWYAVHQGFEVQIAAGGDASHGTGSIYSLASASGGTKDASSGWKTMVITLDGEKIFVDWEGERVTTFDAGAPNLPPQKSWTEPKREHKRPQKGYIGLQTHDPGDIVWFKEVAVRPLPGK
jgi:hypothetical protein